MSQCTSFPPHFCPNVPVSNLLVVLCTITIEPVQELLGKTQVVQHSCWSVLVCKTLPHCLQVTFSDVFNGPLGQEQHFGVVTRIKFSLMLQIKLICFPTLVPCCTASKWRKCYAWAIPLSSLFLQKFCKTNNTLLFFIRNLIWLKQFS